MHKTIQYSVVFVALVVLTSVAMGDAFDQTATQIQTLEAELEQNRTLIEEKRTFIEEQLSTLRENHNLNAPKSQFESDEDYAARLRQLDTEISQRRAELEEQHLSGLLARNIEIQPQIGRLYRRIFQTHEVTATLGEYNANEEFFPITFEATLNGEIHQFNERLPINKDDARNLSDNWDEVIITGWLSIDPGYRRGLAQVKLDYPPLWERGVTWTLDVGYDLGNNTSVAFSPDGKYFATGSNDELGIATLWKVENGEKFRKMDHGDWVNDVAFSIDGKYLATAGENAGSYSYGGKVILWDMHKGTQTHRLLHGSEVHTVVFRPDGNLLASATLAYTDKIQFWSVSDRDVSLVSSISYVANTDTVSACAYSPSGYYFAIGNLQTYSKEHRVSIYGRDWQDLVHKSPVYSLAFSPNEKYLATGSDGFGTFWELDSSRSIRQIDLPNTKIYAIAFSPDGEFFAAGKSNGFIDFFQIEGEDITLETEITRVKSINTGSEVRDLAWHPSGNLISDGKKVYRTLLQPEEVDLASTTSIKTSGDDQQEVSGAGLVNPFGAKLLSSAIAPVNVGTTFTLNITVENITDLAGWQLGVGFNPSVLSAVSVNEGDFLKKSGGTTFFLEGVIDNIAGSITGIGGAFLGAGGVSGTGVLFSITLSAKQVGEGSLQLSDVHLGTPSGATIPYQLTLHPVIVGNRSTAWDVNGDGQVNIFDLIIVAQNLGQSPPTDPRVDVNGDGTVNIFDIIVVAQHFSQGGNPAAPIVGAWPSRPPAQMLASLNPKTVQQWIDLAGVANDGSIAFQLGITNLKQLLEVLVPDKTVLLANYPNPFNPETWIPYELADDARVQLTIYDAKGVLVRQFELGHQMAGYYTNRYRAVYWDGKSETGERVASGIYFYHLQVKNSRSNLGAGDFSAMRKMVIRK